MNTVADLLCGMGGVGLAFREEGFCTAWACDADPVARSVYAANHGITPMGDIWHIDPDGVPEADVVAVGLPCGPFSQMGRRRLWSDPRANVLRPLIGLLCRRRPMAVMVENVPGMTHIPRGATERPLNLLLRCLAGCGYEPSWAILNASEFGGSQHRSRVFVVGDRGGRKLDFARLERRPPGRLGDVLEACVRSDIWVEPGTYVLLDPPSPPSPCGMVLAGYVPGRTIKGRTDVWRYSTHHHTARIHGVSGLTGTLLCRSGLGLLRVGRRVRPPTPLELQRLQGFQDSYLWPVGDAERRRLIGQSVHVQTVRAVARGIADQLL